jgi:small conductance mechanosensitive channel
MLENNLLDNGKLSFATRNLLYTGGIILAALIGRLLAELVIKALVKKMEDEDPDTTTAIEQRTYTLAGLTRNILNILILGTTIVMVLAQWGINITPILTGAGILGLAVGFGAQTLVKDVVTGFFILLENQYNVGDKVKIAGKEGTVTEMNVRTTTLVGNEGKKYLIPNSQITTIEKHSQ